MDNLALPWQPAVMSATCNDPEGPGERRELQEWGSTAGGSGAGEGGHACTGLEQPKKSFPWMAPSTDRGPSAPGMEQLQPRASCPLPAPAAPSPPSVHRQPFHPPAAKSPRPAALAQLWLNPLTIPSPPKFAGFRGCEQLFLPLSPAFPLPALFLQPLLLPITNPLPTGELLYNSQMMKTSGEGSFFSARGHICCPGAPRALVSVCLSGLPVAGAI